MTRKELYNICHDEAVAYANSEQWSKRTGEEKSFLIQGYLDAMMEARKSEITEKKKEYPKTYEECCEVLGHVTIDEVRGYKATLLDKLQMLLVCRDAYWKIAGEEIGLGRPWSPRWDDGYQKKWIINFYKDEINLTDSINVHFVLAFPTEEMRDAFKENFDSDIEFCKELL